METLTQKETRLVLAFVGGLSLMEAGRRAGYLGDKVYQAIKSRRVTRAIAMLEELHQHHQGAATAKKREMLLYASGKK